MFRLLVGELLRGMSETMGVFCSEFMIRQKLCWWLQLTRDGNQMMVFSRLPDWGSYTDFGFSVWQSLSASLKFQRLSLYLFGSAMSDFNFTTISFF